MGGPSINDKFPNLVGGTQDSDNFDLYEYLGDSWGIVFMHPADFTPVCTTELGEAGKRKADFDERNVKICGFSCNDGASHKAVSTVKHLNVLNSSLLDASVSLVFIAVD
jgi:alkyl hydroperoxide reductase subunit AhpC